MTDRLSLIAAARARNLAPWTAIRALGGNTRPIQTGDDARIADLSRASKANPRATAREVVRVICNDIRVDWHAALWALGLWWKRGGPDRPEPWPAPSAQKDA